MTQFAAAANHRLLGGDNLQITEPRYDWSRDSAIISARAQALVCNDAFAAAMVAAKLDNTHGPEGLKRRSLAYLTDAVSVSDDERILRAGIEDRLAWTWEGTNVDVQRILSRKQLHRALDWMATVLGEGFAIRLFRPGQTGLYATRWRLVRPERVSNPDDRPNDDRLYHGIELDADGAPAALWVEMGNSDPFGIISKRNWIRVPWTQPDGTPNVIHRVGWRVPGMLRGMSMFAPLLLLLRQVAGTLEAHVVAKRAQACIPVIYYVDDPQAAAEEARADARTAILSATTKFNPLQVYYAKIGSTVTIPEVKYNGTDLEAFYVLGARVLCSTWQMPVEVALAKMGEASLASARAGLDQLDRTAQGWQNDDITQVGDPLDEAYLREDLARGRIVAGDAGMRGLMAGRHNRPPKYSTDRLKDASTVEKQIAVGRSKSAAFADFGWQYQDETEERVRDDRFEADTRAAAGLTTTTTTQDQ